MPAPQRKEDCARRLAVDLLVAASATDELRLDSAGADSPPYRANRVSGRAAKKLRRNMKAGLEPSASSRLLAPEAVFRRKRAEAGRCEFGEPVMLRGRSAAERWWPA
jgi:hypothetical protein